MSVTASKLRESATRNASLSLYHYLCQNIVGKEDDVKTMRLMNTVRDHVQSNKTNAIITSGSFGEGLEMKGSDLDIMTVVKSVEVCEDTHMYSNADKTLFKMEMEDSQPGFTKLRLLHVNDQKILAFCDKIGSYFYCSNLLFKKALSTDQVPIMHGPCVTDKYGFCDIAYCLHSKLWLTPAKQWVTRSNNSWPCYDVKEVIVKHGVLFVPVGVKGSTKEELEWRISFSVGEKLLINTFKHTQLLCYALMKIHLKDVIALDTDCKELLCSYFIKTVLFWVCEELTPSIWRPENLISCFMRCFRRIIYCVEYSVCPHYFIPENNLFENKIQGQAQKTLLNKLSVLKSYDWQCIVFSYQLSNFHALTFDISKVSSVNSVKKFLTSIMSVADMMHTNFDVLVEEVIYKILPRKRSNIKSMYTYYMSKFLSKSKQLRTFENVFGNKSTYHQFKTHIQTLLLVTNHDVVSGWLMLASFFYRQKQYNTTLCILQYSLLKCTPEKLHKVMKLSDIHSELFNLHVFRKMTIIQLWRFLLLDLFLFHQNSMLLPDEIQFKVEWLIPPVVYSHFLRFLCHFHLKNRRQYWDSLRDLQLTIQENYFIANRFLKASSYNILGITFQLLGDMESAKQTFIRSIELVPDQERNVAFRILSLIR